MHLLLLFTREEVARMWRKREAEWEREKQARERLMAEVRCGHYFQCNSYYMSVHLFCR